MIGRTTAMCDANKGNSDCVLKRRLVRVFNVEAPKGPGVHDLILQERIVPAGSSLGVWIRRRGELQTSI